MSELKPCKWCGSPAAKLRHHDEYSWSDLFSFDEKTKVHLYVCGYCGKVTIAYGD